MIVPDFFQEKVSGLRGFFQTQRGTFVVSSVLALALHVLPVCFVLYVPGVLSNSLELDLGGLNRFRDRIFRDPPPCSAELMNSRPLQISVNVRTLTPARALRMSAAREQKELERSRRFEAVIQQLWTSMNCPEPGIAVVRLHLRGDGSLDENCAVTTLEGEDTFRAFLASFLSALKGSYAGEAGPGELDLECEFRITPEDAS